jgi:hypothetical protein
LPGRVRDLPPCRTDRERTVLAVLHHLFRAAVDVDALRAMGDSDTATSDAALVLTGVRRAELNGLLRRAVEVGIVGARNGVHGP